MQAELYSLEILNSSPRRDTFLVIQTCEKHPQRAQYFRQLLFKGRPQTPVMHTGVCAHHELLRMQPHQEPGRTCPVRQHGPSGTPPLLPGSLEPCSGPAAATSWPAKAQEAGGHSWCWWGQRCEDGPFLSRMQSGVSDHTPPPRRQPQQQVGTGQGQRGKANTPSSSC